MMRNVLLFSSLRDLTKAKRLFKIVFSCPSARLSSLKLQLAGAELTYRISTFSFYFCIKHTTYSVIVRKDAVISEVGFKLFQGTCLESSFGKVSKAHTNLKSK